MTGPGWAELPTPHVLRDYAFLADGERGILLGPRGDISWMCFPHWHDPGLFSELIGGRGTYQITPVDRYVWGGYYEPGTLIWHSRWVTTSAIIECREALAYPGRADHAILLRRITAVQGNAALLITLGPAAEFGEKPFQRLRRDDHGIWRGGPATCRSHGTEANRHRRTPTVIVDEYSFKNSASTPEKATISSSRSTHATTRPTHRRTPNTCGRERLPPGWRPHRRSTPNRQNTTSGSPTQ
jgi:hypothetical protein